MNTIVPLALVLSGAIPSALTSANRVIWIDGQTSVTESCQIAPPDRWQCDRVPLVPQGIVAIVGDRELAYKCFGPCGGDEPAGIYKWGRLVVLDPAAVSPDDLRGIKLSVWKPDRSPFRTATRRFLPTEDSTVKVTRLSDVVFWIVGSVTDPDTFISIDGPTVGSTRLSAALASNGTPEVPLVMSVPAAYALTGRVQTGAGEDVAGADVELFDPLNPLEIRDSPALESLSLVRHATTRSDGNGLFTFERLAPGSRLIVATDSTHGRGSLWLRSVSEPAVVRLIEPVRAHGRVLRRHVPVPSARVRFVPNQGALIASADVRDVLVEETSTGSDGRFVLPLPPRLAGVIQIIAADEGSVRVPVGSNRLTGDLAVGDIELPGQRVLTIRVLDAPSCALAAVGPVGALGLTILQATSSGTVHWFEVPEPGDWFLNAICDGVEYTPEPSVVVVPPSGPELTVDVRIGR